MCDYWCQSDDPCHQLIRASCLMCVLMLNLQPPPPHTHTPGADLGLQHVGGGGYIPQMKSCEKTKEDYAFIHTGG